MTKILKASVCKPAQSLFATPRYHHRSRRIQAVAPVVCASQGPVRKLIIMRHADSEDPKALPKMRDHDRPITVDGRNDAKYVATQLKAAGWLPDVLIASNAVRSRETLDAMREVLPELDYADIHYLGSLYTISQLDGQTRAHLQDIVAGEASEKNRCVLCLGHNKGWEEAATSYAGKSVKLGTCFAALLEGSGETWPEAFSGGAAWELVNVLRPPLD